MRAVQTKTKGKCSKLLQKGKISALNSCTAKYEQGKKMILVELSIQLEMLVGPQKPK